MAYGVPWKSYIQISWIICSLIIADYFCLLLSCINGPYVFQWFILWLMLWLFTLCFFISPCINVQIQNGATYVLIDKTLNPRNGSSALLIQGSISSTPWTIINSYFLFMNVIECCDMSLFIQTRWWKWDGSRSNAPMSKFWIFR